MFEIKPYVDSKFCLECKGCCLFMKEKWLPHLLEDEKKLLEKDRIKLKEINNTDGCEFLNRKNHLCCIYGQRPFECRLYPFLLVRNEKTLDLVVHLACPFIMDSRESEYFKTYSSELVSFLKKSPAVDLLKKEYKAFRVYPEAELFKIESDILGKG
ncbi:MAG: YkgJ family cysteine cluster protein [Candidatus Omnitrophica bacterium]|nr:YkgJ family cysteine cluster protein [Candidatus Omnitrophota bacterium]